ncbi:histidine kinase N-terminal 7TM domain-containing protein [Halobaculum sp. MBLA0147]|uniref:histidine kinase N-terminal 7TM domain-containing protein n=1 Tax=Halobaculum sp. MBLA0147 TaxID=3079934 RepID=UPI00352614DC
MPSVTSLPVLGALGAAGGTVYLLVRLRAYSDAPGADWFRLVLGLQTVYTAAYGIGFLVTDPVWRAVAEVVFWVVFVWIGPTFAAFALVYTGRGGLLSSWPFRITAAVTALLAVVLAATPLHGLTWTEFRLLETAGVVGVTYARGPAVYAAFVVGAVSTAGGAILLFDTVVSYGPLYRGEALAVGVSTLPPAVGATLWTFGLPPTGVNLMPVLALPHVVFDAYAFLGSDMFEFDPATRRASERAAIDDVATPVVIVDTDDRVVTLNTAGETLFGRAKRDALGEPLAELLDEPLDPAAPPESVPVRVDGRRRTFTVTVSSLSDTTGRRVGHTVVLQDVTEQRRRQQRLGVLNRVLRHNLRNDLSVVEVYADQIAATTEGEPARLADEIRTQTAGLVELGGKARSAADALDGDDESRTVALAAVVDDAVGRVDGIGTTTTAAAAGGSAAGDGDGPLSPADLGPVADGAGAESTGGAGAESADGEAEESTDDSATDDSTRDPSDAPAPRVVVDVPADLRLTLDPRPLGLAVETLVENGVTHGGETVVVAARHHDGEVVVSVADDGPGIPDHELSPLAAGRETALDHGSGLGLWLVRWSADALGAELDVDTTDGTTVTLRFSDRIVATESDDGAAEVADE